MNKSNSWLSIIINDAMCSDSLSDMPANTVNHYLPFGLAENGLPSSIIVDLSSQHVSGEFKNNSHQEENQQYQSK